MDRCLIVGVLNCTPDSFSGEGFVEPVKAIEAGLALVEAGADWIDVGGESTRPGAAVVSGHLRGEPATMLENVAFGDVVAEVTAELQERVAAARAAGCTKIWADPGIGFGKRIEHNLELLGALPALTAALGASNVPLMLGVSRKAFIAKLTGKPVAERQFGTAAAVTACALGGAAAVRVHDVAHMRDAVAVAQAIGAARGDRNFRLGQVPVRPSRPI